MTIAFTAYADREVRDVSVALAIERGPQAATIIYSHERGRMHHLPAGSSRLRVRFPRVHLRAGNYSLTLSLYAGTDIYALYDCHIKMYSFTVTEPEAHDYSTRLLELPAGITVEPLG